jgi:hypothetical protein
MFYACSTRMTGMNVRDAVERDADALATLTDLPPDVIRNTIHDRTVRVAEPTGSDDGEEGEPTGGETDSNESEVGDNGDGEVGRDATELTGFVSFDARDDTVHVTQFAGERDACERLLQEPVRFARNEGMRVEVVVTASEEEMRAAVEAVGFEKHGSGPMFEGERTVRYRLTP